MTDKILIQATVAAPKTKVWDCYTEPRHITHWNFASDDWHCPSAENDLRIGGTYKARMAAKDGSAAFDFIGSYTALQPKNAFTYLLEDGRNVTVSFQEEETATKVIVIFDPENQNPAELQRAGWQAILDNFKKYVEGL